MTIKPEKSAQHARRANLEDSRWYLGCLFTVLADAEETGGQFGLIESLSPKGVEPPRHIHSREDEAFHVLEGGITFYIGDETYEATPGTFVFAPRGVPHSYTFETDVIRMLVLITPGGFEEFSGPQTLANLPGNSRFPRPKAHRTWQGWPPRSANSVSKSSALPVHRCRDNTTEQGGRHWQDEETPSGTR